MNARKTRHFVSCLLLGMLSVGGQAQDTLKVTHVQAILYTGSSSRQPLIVGLGGSEGGNAWASNHWKQTREQFLKKGYAFLAIGYFGLKGTPAVLDQIALEDVYHAIKTAALQPAINPDKIAIVGGSRGADLALLLGSYYKDIRCVVGIVPSHVVFPGHTQDFNTSCWTYQGKLLPFVPVNEEAVPFLMKRDLRKTFETMLKDTLAEQKASIRVENINGPILLLSATEDEISPSTDMCKKMTDRLKKHHFKFYTHHMAVEGNHTAPLGQFEVIFDFLEKHFRTL